MIVGGSYTAGLQMEELILPVYNWMRNLHDMGCKCADLRIGTSSTYIVTHKSILKIKQAKKNL